MSTDDKISALRDEYIADAARRFDHYMSDWAESPIEQLLLAQMLVEGWSYLESHGDWKDAYDDLPLFGLAQGGRFLWSDTNPCRCVVQAELNGPNKYRLDFAFIGRRYERTEEAGLVRIAVELDGHDFHDRTKEQASRDRRRDRFLIAHGWTVLRYTGSDVYRDPLAILDEVEKHCRRLCWPNWGLG